MKPTVKLGRAIAELDYGRDCREALREQEAGSVHCVVTSPPYWGLRDYGTGDAQIGLEATPDAYVDQIVDVFREVRRVLHDSGTLWLNLGDSYATSSLGGPPGDQVGSDGYVRTNRGERRRAPVCEGLKNKDLVGIPWMVAFALRADGWYLRSDVIWAKRQPMPESIRDRPTKSHEYLFLLSKSPTYFYDWYAASEAGTRRAPGSKTSKYNDAYNDGDERYRTAQGASFSPGYVRRNRRTVWSLASSPYPGAHFATFPPALVEPCVQAGSSAHGVCPACGAPFARVLERENHGGVVDWAQRGWDPTCACGLDPVPATILDPFSGSATTGEVALGLGRNYLGLDLGEDYLALALARIQGRPPPRPHATAADHAQIGLFQANQGDTK